MQQLNRYQGRTRQVRPDQLRPGQMIVAIDGLSTAAWWPQRRWPVVSQRPYPDDAGNDPVVVVPCDTGVFNLHPDEPVTIAA